MGAPLLQPGRSIDYYWQNLVYTTARGGEDPRAKDLLDPITAFVGQAGRIRLAQWERWQAEIAAQAAVDLADDDTDDAVDDFARVLDDHLRDRKDPRYRRYFAIAPSEIKALALKSELDQIRKWPEYLAAEATPELQAYAARFRDLIARGDAALQRLAQAEAARANHHDTEIDGFVRDANAARDRLHAQLVQRASELGLSRKWPDRFFPHRKAAAKAEPQPA